MTDNVPDFPPPFWVFRQSYTNVPVDADGPVAQWAAELVAPYGYTWASINEWRWVQDGEVPFAEFVCMRSDGGRDWLTITYASAPPTAIDRNVNARLL